MAAKFDGVTTFERSQQKLCGLFISLKLLVSRNDFNGEMTTYGAGNDDNLNTVKAGPGTIYVKEDKKRYLTVSGDTDSSVQKQTKTYISGGANEFTYDKLTLDGNFSFLRNF